MANMQAPETETVSIAQGKDNRVIVDSSAMRKNDDAAEPIQQDRTYQPEELWSPIDALDGEGRNIKRENCHRVQSTRGCKRSYDRQIAQAVITACRIRKSSIDAHGQLNIPFHESQAGEYEH